MKYISLLLSFLILSTPVFGQVNETWKASTFTLPGLGVLTKAELYRLQGVTSNVQSQLDLKELLSNKATSLASPDNTKYPTTQAVSTGLSTGLALKEDTANKATSLATPDNVKFPTTQAVATGLGLKQDTITGAASTITTSNLSTSKAMVTDGSGKAAASATVDTTELGYLDGVTSSVQTQINTNSTNISTKVTGPASATDEAVARYDATTGKLIQDSKVTIDDNGLLTTLGTSGAGVYNQGKDYVAIWGDGGVTTGSNATLDITNFGSVVLVANSSLVSISNITPIPSTQVRRFTLINNTGNSITIVNDPTTGVASTGIYTGTGQDITIGNKASVTFIYNSTRWGVVGGSGSGSGGVSDLDVAFYQDFESAKLTDFTQTGLTIDATSAVHLKKSALLTHNASTVQSFKQVQALDPKFRGKNLSLKVDCKSTATTGNVTVSVFDETNSTTLLASTQLACSTSIDSYYASFDTASTTASVSYTVSALVQSGSPTTYVDDIVAYITKLSRLSSSITVPKAVANSFGAKISSTGVISDEVRDHINGNCSVASSVYTCNFQGLTASPNCSFGTGPLGTQIQITTQTSSQIVFSTYNSGGTLTPVNTQINCEKTGADYVDPLTATESKSIQLTQSALVQNPDSSIRVDTANGFGSINTAVRRFTPANTRESYGSAVTMTDSATLGTYFTINEDGVYSISYQENGATATYFAITKDAVGADLLSSTGVLSFNPATRLAFGTTGASSSFPETISWTGVLTKDSIIRAEAGSTTGTNSATAFTITKQGSLKQANINTNSKIKIPTSELRFEGSSSRGTGSDTGIVKFDSITKLSGDAFDINPNGADTTFGTHVKMKKSGYLCTQSSIYNSSASSGQVLVTKNMALRTTPPTWGTNESFSSNAYGGVGTAAGLGVAGCGMVTTGDTLRVASGLTPTSNQINFFHLTFQEQDIQVSVSNILPQYSESDQTYRVDTANGFGSTNTKVRRFSSVRENTAGADFSCQDSATLGLTCTVLKSGSFSISYSLTTDSGTPYACIAKNLTPTEAAALCSSTLSSAPEKILANPQGSSSTVDVNASWTGNLSVGDIIYPYSEGAANSIRAVRERFTMSKIGKPNVTTDVSAFVNIPVMDSQWSELTSTTSVANTTLTGSLTKSTGSGVYTYNSTTGVYTMLKKAKIDFVCRMTNSGAGSAAATFNLNGSGVLFSNVRDTAAYQTIANWSGWLDVNDVFSCSNSSTNASNSNYIRVTATITPDNTVTPVESFSTDANALTWAADTVYTLSTLPNSTKGTYITWSYATGLANFTQCTTVGGRPNQSDASMAADGILIYGRAYNATSSCAQPARLAINIGKGHKGKLATLYKSSGKTTAGSIEWNTIDGTITIGAFTHYDEKNGILLIDAGFNWFSTTTSHTFTFSDATQQTSGYVVINASKNSALAGVAVSASAIMTPNLTKVRECYASYGGAGATLSSPTECSTGACTEVEDSCQAFTPPTFATTGNYGGLVIANGTFAANTPITCDCKGFTTTTGIVRACDVAFKTGGNTWMTNSSGGYSGDVWAYSATGTASNGYFRISCKAVGP